MSEKAESITKTEMTKIILEMVNRCLRYSRKSERYDRSDIILTEKNTDDDLREAGLESLGFISLILELEERFSVEIPDEYLLLTELSTVRKIADVTEHLMRSENE